MKPLNDTDIRIASFKDALSIAEVHVQSWKETYTGMIKQEILDELNVLDKQQLEPYRVCRRLNILRDYSDEKTKLYPRN
ncbi:hypothetical protein CV950_002415 [Acinetobacter baumannii]|nr:hypothetical protein CV950_002415 [Acinetobacter baumannii]